MLNTQLKVGAFILLMSFIAGYLIITFGKGGFDRNLVPYYVYFDDASGLRKGSEVQIKGVKAGRVDEITIDENGKVKVKILVDEKFPLYKDAKVYIRTLGLMGDKYIYIDPGTAKSGKIDLKSNGKLQGHKYF